MLKYIFFDMDGVISETEPVHFESEADAFLELWIKWERQDLIDFIKDFAWVSFDEVARSVFEKYWNHTNIFIEHIFDKKNSLFKKTLEKVHPIISKWLLETLKYLKENRIKMWIVSSSTKIQVEETLDFFWIKDFFEFQVNFESVKNHKPNPDPYLLALEKAWVERNEVLIIEDSQSGVRSWVNAWIDVIALRSEFTKNHDHSSAIFIANNFFEIKNFLEREINI